MGPIILTLARQFDQISSLNLFHDGFMVVSGMTQSQSPTYILSYLNILYSNNLNSSSLVRCQVHATWHSRHLHLWRGGHKNFDELLLPCHVAQAQLKVSSSFGNSSSPNLHFSRKYVRAITHQPLRFSKCFRLVAWRTCFSSSLNFCPKVSKTNEEKGNETENCQP